MLEIFQILLIYHFLTNHFLFEVTLYKKINEEYHTNKINKEDNIFI